MISSSRSRHAVSRSSRHLSHPGSRQVRQAGNTVRSTGPVGGQFSAVERGSVFDLTKVWPHKDYPTIPIGRMVLDRNPENFFAQVTQAAFEVSNMVPGIGPSPDRMVLGRMVAYGDSQR